MKFVELWVPQHTDGHTSIPCGGLYIKKTDADAFSRNKHGNYSTLSKKIYTVTEDDMNYYILDSNKPVKVTSPDPKERKRQAALCKLTKEEKKLLGLKE